ncbi:MAG: S8 family serine peptidase [Patescibacteria group bacterium]
MRKKVIVPISILVFLILAGGFFFFRDRFKADTLPTNKSGIVQNQKPKYATNQILVRLKKVDADAINSKKTSISATIDPKNTGDTRLDSLNNLLKSSAISSVANADLNQNQTESLPSAVDTSSPLNRWHTITLAGEGKLTDEDPAKALTEVSLGTGKKMTMLEVMNMYKSAGVEEVSPNYIATKTALPNDALLGTQLMFPGKDDLWGLKNIGAPAAWDITKGNGVVVAVIDTGVDYNHPDLKNNMLRNSSNSIVGYNFVSNNRDVMDDDGHGTHVAGIIAAIADNDPDHTKMSGKSNIGVGPELKIMPLKGLGLEGGDSDGLVSAIRFAVDNGAKVISCSWGLAGYHLTIFDDAIQYAHDKNVVTVFAAGNDTIDVKNFTPAGNKYAITVGASNSEDNLAGFSNYGNRVDLIAPGGDSSYYGGIDDLILSTKLNSKPLNPNYGGLWMNQWSIGMPGTSMAAPFVSASAAMVLALHPDYSPEEVRFALDNSATKLDNRDWSVSTGFGRLDVAKALGLQSAPPVAFLDIDERNYGLSKVNGTVSARSVVKSWKLEYSSDLTPTDWKTAASGTAAMSGLLATMPTGLDGYYSLRLSVTDTNDITSIDYADSMYDRDVLTGWPKEWATEYYIQPAIGDINGDGKNEVVSADAYWINQEDTGILIHAFQSDGKEMANFPVTLKTGALDCAGCLSSIVLADIDNDGKQDIVESATMLRLNAKADKIITSSAVYVVNGNGKVIPGWPFELPVGRSALPTVVDVNNDGQKEVLLETADSKVYILSNKGKAIPSWPVSLAGQQEYKSAGLGQVAAVDVNADGQKEIVASDTDSVYVYNLSGVLQPGWPQKITSRSSVLGVKFGISDINNDGDNEIVARTYADGICDDTTVCHYTVATFDGAGKLLWEKSTADQDLADVDALGGSSPVFVNNPSGSGQLIFIGGYKGNLLFDSAGKIMEGWPNSFFLVEWSQVSVADINNDGVAEIVGPSWCTDPSCQSTFEAYNLRGEKVLSKGFAAQGPSAPLFGDINGDGRLDMVGNARGEGSGWNLGAWTLQIYAWELPTTVGKNAIPWSQAGGDAAQTNGAVLGDGTPPPEVENLADIKSYKNVAIPVSAKTKNATKFTWSKKTGPADLVFENSDKQDATVKATVPGKYEVDLSAESGAKKATKTLNLIIHKSGDINNDGAIDELDFASMLGNWGAPKNVMADYNRDRVVDELDFATLLTNWNK